jgi:cytochrome b561
VEETHAGLHATAALTLRVITFWLASSPSLLPPPQAANRLPVIASNNVLDALFFIVSLLDTWFGIWEFPPAVVFFWHDQPRPDCDWG